MRKNRSPVQTLSTAYLLVALAVLYTLIFLAVLNDWLDPLTRAYLKVTGLKPVTSQERSVVK